jgi:hypothetical protein
MANYLMDGCSSPRDLKDRLTSSLKSFINRGMSLASGTPESLRKSEFRATEKLYKTSGFHGGDYEEWRLLGCYAVWLL